jgi:pimeloyl-ACP methyl ester carboxylesterase
MRGVGENSGLKIDPNKSALSQWIVDMDKVISTAPAILWGHSWGALQVLSFAKTYPDRVAKLILSNPVDPALLSMAQIDNKLFSHPDIDSKLTLDEIGTDAEKLHNFRSKIASYFADDKQGWDYALTFSPQDSNKSLNVRIWEDYIKSPLSDADIRQLSNKVLGLIHCRDDILQPESQSEYQRLLDKPKQHILNVCAHFPWIENPEDYFAALMNLLDK